MSLLPRVAGAGAMRPTADAASYRDRITDPAAWNAWLARITGKEAAALEVVNRTLRVRDGVAAPVLPEQPVVVAKFEPLVVAPEPAPASIQDRVLAIVAEKTGYP